MQRKKAFVSCKSSSNSRGSWGTTWGEQGKAPWPSDPNGGGDGRRMRWRGFENPGRDRAPTVGSVALAWALGSTRLQRSRGAR
jgi:hypothetical protein